MGKFTTRLLSVYQANNIIFSVVAVLPSRQTAGSSETTEAM